MEGESSHFVDTGIIYPALASVERDNWKNAWEAIEVDEDSHRGGINFTRLEDLGKKGQSRETR